MQAHPDCVFVGAPTCGCCRGFGRISPLICIARSTKRFGASCLVCRDNPTGPYGHRDEVPGVAIPTFATASVNSVICHTK